MVIKYKLALKNSSHNFNYNHQLFQSFYKQTLNDKFHSAVQKIVPNLELFKRPTPFQHKRIKNFFHIFTLQEFYGKK